MRGAWAVLVAAAVVGCGNDSASLRVDVRTDLAPGVEIDRITVEVDGVVLEHEVDPTIDYLAGTRVARFEDLSRGSVRATVRLLRNDAEVLSRPVTVQLESDSGVTVVLTRDCRGVMCPDAGDATLAACLGGRCVDERCTEEDTTECAEPECMVAADCGAADACAVAQCIGGTCLYGDGGSCSGDEYCDPERGCLARPGSGPGVILVSDLAPVWSTSNQIRWTWTLAGDEAEFRELRIELGDSAETVGDRVVSGSENPELGSFLITASDRTLATTTFDHQSDASVFARVVAVDTQGRMQQTEIVEGRTAPDAADAVVVFMDDPTAGYSIPGEFLHSDADPHMGSHAYEATHTCDAMESVCWEIYRRQDIGIDLSEIPADRVDGAFLEWSAQITADSLYSSVRIFLGPPGARRLYAREGFALRGDGRYRTYQWPLRELIDMGEGVDHAALQDGMYEFGIGGAFPVGTTIRWDEVSVRY